MSPARRLSISLVLLGLGVVLLYLSTSQVWFSWQTKSDTFGSALVQYKGSSENGFGALALGALAAGAALIATRGRARFGVAVITAALAVGIGGLAIRAISHHDDLLAGVRTGPPVQGISFETIRADTTSVWPYVAVIAAVFILAGALVGASAARGGGSLSTRYEPPTGTPPAPVTAAATVPGQADVAAWQALDRDEDPTGG